MVQQHWEPKQNHQGQLPKQDWLYVHSAMANPIMCSQHRKRGEHGRFAQVCSFESLSAQEKVVTCDVCIWWHKSVYTWAAERGVGCPKLVMTWARAVLCNQGRQGLITGDTRQDVRLCQHPSPTAAQGQEPQGEGEQGIYTSERPRRALVDCVTPRGEACPRALSLHFPKRTELCFQVSTLPLFFIHVYR